MRYFEKTDTIFDITERYPVAIDFFAANGFELLKNDAMRKTMGKTITLELALKSRKIQEDAFYKGLEECIEQGVQPLSAGLSEAKKETGGDVRVTGVLPCPIRLPMLERFEAFLKENEEKLGLKVDYDLKAASMGANWMKEQIQSSNVQDESVLSDLYLSAGFELFFDKDLMGKFRQEGIFKDVTGVQHLNAAFENEQVDFRDPKGQYAVIGVVPAIFMVNKDMLGERKLPRSWADLMTPEFENTVSLPMKDLDMFNAILINIYAKYGEEGITKLGRTLLKSMHPAEMVKANQKKGSNSGPIITVMPYFFTQMVQGNPSFEAVWPEDGAIASPIFMLTKKSSEEKIKPIAQFLFSKEVGSVFAGNGKFPSTHPDVDNHMEHSGTFLWPGWEFIDSHDVGVLLSELEQLFYRASERDEQK